MEKTRRNTPKNESNIMGTNLFADHFQMILTHLHRNIIPQKHQSFYQCNHETSSNDAKRSSEVSLQYGKRNMPAGNIN